MAALPEPSQDELQAMGSLADVLYWAGLKGNCQYKYSMAGALIDSLGGEEAADMTIGEFGAIKCEHLEAAIDS